MFGSSQRVFSRRGSEVSRTALPRPTYTYGPRVFRTSKVLDPELRQTYQRPE